MTAGSKPITPCDQERAASFRQSGDALFHQGKFNQAIRSYRQALKIAPRDAELHYMLAEASGRKGWRIAARAFYCKAFRMAAAQLRRLQCELAAAEVGTVSRQETPKSIFVLGCSHSGTTILTRLLANHPNLMHAHQGESHAFLQAKEPLQSTLQTWDVNCREQRNSGWVEKSVSHCFQIPRIIRYRPDALFVIVLRDGRDVTTSMKSRKYAYRKFRDLVNLWVCANRTILHYRNEERFHVLRYEDLVREPETTLNKVCTAIGENFQASMLDYHHREISWNEKTGARRAHQLDAHDDHQRLRHWQINQPLFDGCGRWVSEMEAEDKKTYKAIAGRYAEKWGYAANYDLQMNQQP